MEVPDNKDMAAVIRADKKWGASTNYWGPMVWKRACAIRLSNKIAALSTPSPATV